MNALEWPADLTDFRLPAKWDGQRVDWHGWHPHRSPHPVPLREQRAPTRSATMFRLRAPVPTLVEPRIDGRRARLHHHRTLRVLQHDHRTRDRAGRDKRMDVG